MFSVIGLLESKGHKVVPFSIDYSKNRETLHSKYFASPPVSKNHVYFKDSRLTLYDKLRLFGKIIYNFEAKKKIKEAIKKEKIDIAYTLQIVNFLYPGVIDGCKEMNIPLVARFSDFQLLCPAYTFFRNREVCEDCKNGYYWALKNRCLQNSYTVSLARVFTMYIYKILKINRKIDIFIAPSEFLRRKLIEYGFDETKIVHIPTYVDLNNYEPGYTYENYILYVGPILKYKGVEYLLKAFEKIKGNIKLKIAGSSSDGEDKRLKKYAQDKNMTDVEFLGFKAGKELKELYQNAMFIVVPSIWYENMPNVILESMAYGKPVIGSNLGSIPEVIDDNVDGLLFEPKNVKDLTRKIQYLIDNKNILFEMGKKARQKIEEKYNPELHYERLIKVYQNLLAKKKGSQ